MKKFVRLKTLGLLWLICQLPVAAQVVTVPAPSNVRAERWGTINWNVDYGAYPQGQPNTPDRLNWGANAVASLGTKVIGLYLGFYDVYGIVPPGVNDLATLAQSAPYDQLFRDERFKTYCLWTYSRGATANNWLDGFSPTEFAAEREDMRKLGEYLLNNPALAGKTFILFNWEAENAIVSHANKDATWQAMREWHRARVEGVRLAQQRYPNSAVKVFSGLQYARVWSYATGQPCGSRVNDPVNADPLLNRCAIDFFGADLPFDYYGYSAWQTVNQKIDDPSFDLKAGLKRDLDFWLAYVRAKRPEVTSYNFLLLDYGFERARYNECVAADFMDEMIAALEGPGAFPVAYTLWWQVIDNAPHFGYGVGDEYFGFYRTLNGQLNLSLPGQVLQKRLANQPFTRVTDCPVIRKPPAPSGILDLQTGTTDFRLYPNSTLDIHTEDFSRNPFSASDNVVHVDQRAQRFALSRNNSPSFTESAARLNAPLPEAVRSGTARVWLTDARGLSSNTQVIELRCDSCPFIKNENNCGVIEAEFQTFRLEPGEKLAINGERFGASGNSVIIEQQGLLQSVNSITVPRANFVSESTTQIVIILPAGLTTDYISLYVINPQGRPSNAVSGSIEPPCTDCTPRLRPCGALVSLATTGEAGKFYASELFEIRGRLPKPGNKIILEQYDRNYQPYRYVLSAGSASWQETSKQLTARLPTTLFPGRALVYVEDAAGLVSRAYAIKILPRSVVSVSAANYRGPEVARESILAAFGNAFGTVTMAGATNPLPTELAGVKVVVRDSTGTDRMAPLFFVSPTQINYQVPAGTALGTASVTFFNAFGSSAVGEINVVAVTPALFTANANGQGVAAANVVRVRADGTQAQATEEIVTFDLTLNRWVANPINLGAETEQVFLILYGTGWRGRTAPATVMIGGLNSEVTFAAAQGQLIGLDQANVRIPRSLTGRGIVSVVFTADSKMSNTVEVNVR